MISVYDLLLNNIVSTFMDICVYLCLCAFQVTISCGPDNYEVFVNGKKAHAFSRGCKNMEEIDVLEVSGDVQLTFVQP